MNRNSSKSIYSFANLKKTRGSKLGFVFAMFIIFQFYFLGLVCWAFKINDSTYRYLFDVGSHTIVVLSIIVFSYKNLEFFRDRFSAWVIVASCLLSVIVSGGVIYKGFMFFLGIILSIYTYINQKDINVLNGRTLVFGFLWSVGAVVILASIYAVLDRTYANSFSVNVMIIINAFVFQIAHVSVIEESCFRGLLFNFMIMNGYKENKALFFQGILFWGTHYFIDFDSPLRFFIIVPLSTLIVTLIIKKYRALYLSIMAHTFINVFTMLLVSLINQYLF